ncbi:MAG: hypothetical protein HQL78_04840 [Magnetococcales bacterium]|nr:hypothetical protein [Magnetococcales bacterium]
MYAHQGDFFVSVVIVILIGKLKHVHCRRLWSAALVNFIGVVLHEVAHFIVAWLLGGRPTRFSVWPQRTVDGFLFGHVVCARMNTFNALPIGLAPLMLLPVAWMLDRQFFVHFPRTTGSYIIYLFLLVIIIENALPSTADWRVVWKYPIGLVGWGGVLFAYLWQSGWL